jgi:hypothetical protein
VLSLRTPALLPVVGLAGRSFALCLCADARAEALLDVKRSQRKLGRTMQHEHTAVPLF